jgi:hypothetical protein
VAPGKSLILGQKTFGFVFDGVMAYYHSVPSRSSKDHDFTTVGRRVVEQAIGEKLTGEPLDDPNKGKSPAAVALGKLGGAQGGAARAVALTPEQRQEIARTAAQARWKKSQR